MNNRNTNDISNLKIVLFFIIVVIMGVIGLDFIVKNKDSALKLFLIYPFFMGCLNILSGFLGKKGKAFEGLKWIIAGIIGYLIINFLR